MKNKTTDAFQTLKTTSLLIALVIAALASSIIGQSVSTEAVEANPKNPDKYVEAPKTGAIKFQQEIVKNVFLSDIAQTTSYVFATTTTGSLTDMTSGTTTILAANLDDTASPLTNIGFDFYFQGVRYSQFGINDNGVLRLGAASQTGSPYQPLAQAAIPLITAYGADQRTHTSGLVRYKVIGAAPNRTLVVEWFNMQSNFASGGTADLTYQVQLSETTGVIRFVYGSMTLSAAGAADANSNDPHIGFSSTNTANNVGSVTAPQAGAPTYDGSNADPVENLYVAGAITVLSGATDGARRTMTFTPPVPTAPTGLNFTAVTSVSMNVNWTDSADEDAYAIYRSTDGINFSFVGSAAENATTFADSGLSASTNYFYNVYSVSEGALSTALSGSQMSGAPGNDTCNGAGGLWNTPGTWTDGSVPTAGDNVTIGAGCTVTINSSNALSVTVQSGGVLQFEDTTARTLTVGNDVTINSGGTFQSGVGGTQTGHVLSVGGSITNNGTLDFSTNANTAGANITFAAGASNVTFGGSGGTTDIRGITVAKGAQAVQVEMLMLNLTVQGVNTDVAGYLTLTSGTFKISGNFTMTNRTFATATYVIPALGGIWLNNPNYTVAGTASGTTTGNSGLFRLSQGIYTIGLTGAHGFQAGAAGATYIIEGGTLNANGRFDPQTTCTFTMTGGTINAGIVGNTVSSFGTFELFSATNVITISGGNINLVNPSTAATKDDYVLRGTLATINISGGTVTFGTVGAGTYTTPFGTTYAPNVVINAGSTWNINNVTGNLRGATLVNNGAIISTGASARFDFARQTSAMTYSGTGTFGTLAVPFGGIGVSANSTFLTTLNAPIFCFRVNLFQGGFINSNQITLGNAAASTTVVQIGSTGLTTPGGSFDVSPVHNQGTGGEILLYAFETTARTTGFEVNPTRILTSISLVDNPLGLTIAGGDITLTSAAVAIVMTNGEIITGNNTLIMTSGTATVTRTNGYVRGNFRKTYTAAASKVFEVGENGYTPVTVNATAGTFPSTMTVASYDATLAGMNPPTSLSRNWLLVEGGDITATLSFTYLDPQDVPGSLTEANLRAWRRDTIGSNPTFTDMCGAPCVNTATNVLGPVAGVTTFSRWGGGEAAVVVAAHVDIGGRVTSADGMTGLGKVTVVLSGGNLPAPRLAMTNPFGYYNFEDLEVGATYTVTVGSKQYTFTNPTMVISPNDNVTNANFFANP